MQIREPTRADSNAVGRRIGTVLMDGSPGSLASLRDILPYARDGKTHVSMLKVFFFILSEIANETRSYHCLLSQEGVILKISCHWFHFPKLLWDIIILFTLRENFFKFMPSGPKIFRARNSGFGIVKQSVVFLHLAPLPPFCCNGSLTFFWKTLPPSYPDSQSLRQFSGLPCS